jgi:hypothetical protein
MICHQLKLVSGMIRCDLQVKPAKCPDQWMKTAAIPWVPFLKFILILRGATVGSLIFHIFRFGTKI